MIGFDGRLLHSPISLRPSALTSSGDPTYRVWLPGYYDSFRNLGVALMANVVLALVTSVLQLTLGFIPYPWAVGICLGFGGATICLLIFLWWQVASNLMKWFEGLEKKRNRERAGKNP